MRTVIFTEKEFYHIYNRGVDKRIIFSDQNDFGRFLQGMDMFNSIENTGSIYEKTYVSRFGRRASKNKETKALVNIIAYCLNPNHYHFILEQIEERGIEKFMHKLGTGYSKYFNTKYKRSGTLFEGKFKAIHIDSNEYLLHLSAYINLNDRAHGRKEPRKTKTRMLSSWEEYTNSSTQAFCKKEVILEQFRNKGEYKSFAEDALENIIQRKKDLEEVGDYLLE
jgi:putative transposase